MPTPKKALASGRVPERKAGKLTEKQELFCQKFLISLNATRAYKEAYQSADSTADTEGPKLLGNPRIAERLAELKKERNKRLDISKDRILRLLIDRVESKLDDAMEWDNNQVTLKSSRQLSLRTRRNLKKVTISETKHGTDKVVELKDDGAALALLAKHVGLFDKENGSDSEPGESALDRILGAVTRRRKR